MATGKQEKIALFFRRLQCSLILTGPRSTGEEKIGLKETEGKEGDIREGIGERDE